MKKAITPLLWIAAGIVLLITTIETERLQKRVNFLEEQWIAHDSAGRLGTDSLWSRWKDASKAKWGGIVIDSNAKIDWLAADSIKLGGVGEANTDIHFDKNKKP